MTVPRQAVLFVGGRGERLMPLTAETPKPMVPIHGRPFLEYLIEQLHDAGVKDVLLLAGYKGDQIATHFGWTQGVRTAMQPEAWETGRRLKEVASLLDPQFLLLYGDNFAPVSLPWLAERHAEGKQPLTVTVCEKSGGNASVILDGLLSSYGKGTLQSHVEIGYMMAERDWLLPHLTDGSFSETIAEMAPVGQVASFTPGCPYWSISDPERLKLTAEMLKPKKIILLDRDGVLNEKAPKGEYVTGKNFRWVHENIAALTELAKRGFTFVVITNQAGIGRGMMSQESVDHLHLWMRLGLASQGIHIIDTFVCPHHWGDNCRCRKPLPGMFFDAAKRHNIRLDRTIYVGDDERDQTAAMRAGCGAFVQLLGGNPLCPSAVIDTFKEWGIE